MRKLLLVLFSTVLLLSCSADEVSREGGSTSIPERYLGHWKEDTPNGIEMWVEEQRFIIKISETRTDTITEWYSATVEDNVGTLYVQITQDLRNSISIDFMSSINDIELVYEVDGEYVCIANMLRQ